MRRTSVPVLLAGIVLALPAVADEVDVQVETTEGSNVRGKLHLDTVPVKSDLGDLAIPVVR